MRSRYELSLSLWLLSAPPAFAADINAPLNETPTIASEIRRGEMAAVKCNGDNLLDPLAFSKCTSAAAMADEQRHRNSAPFQLGLYWQESVLNTIQVEGGGYGADVNELKTFIATSYQGFRFFQKQLDLTDEQIVTAVAANDPAYQPLLDQLHSWERNPPEGGPQH